MDWRKIFDLLFLRYCHRILLWVFNLYLFSWKIFALFIQFSLFFGVCFFTTFISIVFSCEKIDFLITSTTDCQKKLYYFSFRFSFLFVWCELWIVREENDLWLPHLSIQQLQLISYHRPTTKLAKQKHKFRYALTLTQHRFYAIRMTLFPVHGIAKSKMFLLDVILNRFCCRLKFLFVETRE